MNQKRLEMTSMTLHLLAMLFMLFDHLWGTIVPGNNWMNCIGRISFPIFAFMIVEGYHHTRNLKKYLLRLLLCALISEIPFNLAMGGRVFYPIHQNVLWTFLISIGLIRWNEKARQSVKHWKMVLVGCLSVISAYILGIVTFVDYYHAGILMVLAFYFFRGRNWWNYLGQFLAMAYINLEILGGIGYEFQLFGETWFFARQGFALLALIPIWLYRGKQGYHSRGFRMFCYLFYPVHLLILGLLRLI